MADAATQQLIDQIVQEYVQAGTMFTAFDVTTETRKRGGNVRHNEVRDLVHEFYQQGRLGASYNRSVVDVGAPTKPFVYHRFSDNPRNYTSPGGPAASGGSAPPPKPQSQGFIQRMVTKIFGDGAPAPARPPVPPQQWTPGSRSQSAAPGSTPSSTPPPKSTTLALDAAQFLPITRADLIKSARGIRLWSGIFWGRRDLIPPADDPRTKLIDRGMVSQGLLSAEQLAEIHSVGSEMDKVRPVMEAIQRQAQEAGKSAVDASREERAKLRSQKKAEAAEGKKKRAEAIAHRKATDILFLGRGVSGRLGERTSDIEKLEASTLPILSTPAELASALDLTIPQLRWLSFHTEVATRTHYLHFTVPKKSGGTRTLSSPHRLLAKAQRWILCNILNKLSIEDPAHGFITQRSILSNAQQHTSRNIIINMDLENFFPSITFPRIRSVFFRAGYSPAVATILALICTECPRRTVELAGQTLFVAMGPRGLPQGACTSPSLSNQVARRLDKRLLGMAQKHALTYTRYADDITISGNGELQNRIGWVMARVRHLADEEGFRVNESKSRILRRSTAQKVTGLVVNDRPGVARSDVRRIRAILHHAKSEGLEEQNRSGHPNFSAWLEGMISYIGMARPEVAAKLRQQLRALSGGNGTEA